uniref:MTOR-associated protein MEAK7 n=1 Tax=Homalodisca liturata TaxID=320908 RepID=A0A1B6IP57_9HEMI
MGGKQSLEKPSRTSLNPTERRRLTLFLEKKGSHSQFNKQDMQRLWKDYLVPDLLKSYTDYLMNQARGKQTHIGIEEFVWIYSALIRGDEDEKVTTLIDIIGSSKNSSGQHVISFKTLCKYISDLLESFFLGLQTQTDPNYISWTYHKQPERVSMETVTRGVCDDLPRNDDEVQVSHLQRWLNTSVIVAVLHSYVLGSLYNLEPEVKDTVVPLAIWPTIKTQTFLDLSQVIYINSFIPNQHRTLWRFLFSTQTHGESFAKLIGSIANQGALVIVIHAENHTFGGFISEEISPGPRWVGDSDCFLFRLNPVASMFPSTGYNDHYVYFNSQQQSLPNGLGMGGQYNYWGLWIDSQFGFGECSESCTTFKDYKMLTNKKKFRISKMEAWGVGEPPPTPHERGERDSRAGTTVLERESVHTHLLEMAGRKMYSKGIGRDIPN